MQQKDWVGLLLQQKQAKKNLKISQNLQGKNTKKTKLNDDF